MPYSSLPISNQGQIDELNLQSLNQAIPFAFSSGIGLETEWEGSSRVWREGVFSRLEVVEGN